jgi:hypothetical protein
MNVLEKIDNYLNEKSIKIEKIKENGTVMKGKATVGIGDIVEIKDGAKPVKGKNKVNVAAAEIEEIKGDTVKLQAGEEGEFWYKVTDVYWAVD